MRRPTKVREMLAWHSAAMAGTAPATHDGIVHCGWFKRRLRRGGPWVPVRIYLDREIDPATGELAGPEEYRIEVEGLDGGRPADHWTYLTPISKAEFDHLVDYRLRDGRMFDPRQPIDLSEKPTEPQGAI